MHALAGIKLKQLTSPNLAVKLEWLLTIIRPKIGDVSKHAPKDQISTVNEGNFCYEYNTVSRMFFQSRNDKEEVIQTLINNI